MLPDFLVVSPPKSGTSWLAANLSRHPHILVPLEKEVRYFDKQWRHFSLEWCCQRFVRGPEQLAADVSPTYALLPDLAIKHIRSLKPDLKFVVLLRDLPARAWSHLKHMRVHGEANFEGRAGSVESAQHNDLIWNLVDDYSLSASDYEGMLRRWLRWFPKEQFHVAFFEDAVAAPERYFAQLFAFLGVERELCREFVLGEVNEGPDSPPTADNVWWMEKIYVERYRRLERYLKETFALTPPWPEHRTDVHNDGPKPLPGRVAGRTVALDKGLFWHAEEGQKLAPSGGRTRSPAALPAQFVGDLLRSSEPAYFAAEAKLRQHGLSLEDLRLIHQLDRIAEIEARRMHDERNKSIALLETRLEDGRQRLMSLEAALAERTQRLVSLEAALAERTQRLVSLEAAFVERTERLASIETALAERTRRLLSLEAAFVERTERLASIETALAERTERLASLESTLQERGSRLSSLEATSAKRVASRQTAWLRIKSAVAQWLRSGRS